jgi:hypothetical protein
MILYVFCGIIPPLVGPYRFWDKPQLIFANAALALAQFVRLVHLNVIGVATPGIRARHDDASALNLTLAAHDKDFIPVIEFHVFEGHNE